MYVNANSQDDSILFEGVEKRIELLFDTCIPFISSLRSLYKEDIDTILDAAKCSSLVKKSLGTFDAYILSESSLFVYDHKIILLTCGTTSLLLAIPVIIQKASSICMNISGCHFTRGAYIFPENQQYPHRSFEQECAYLESQIPLMTYTYTNKSNNTYIWQSYQNKEDIMSIHKKVYTNIAVGPNYVNDIRRIINIYTDSHDDYIFDPCGYSLNAYKDSGYIAIHVTPQSNCSYVSIETYGIRDTYIFLHKLHDMLFEVFHYRPLIQKRNSDTQYYKYTPVNPSICVGSA